MTWCYRIAKKKDLAGVARYSLVEAYLNDDGEVWGYTGHQDILSHIQYDDYDDDEQVIEDIQSTLLRVMLDSGNDIIDIDTFEPASSGFEEELEAIKSEN